MGYKYPADNINTSPTLPFRASYELPMDERCVIETRQDLVTETTWGHMRPGGIYTNRTYDGIIVTVVDDPIPNNNGVYYLLKRSKYLTFADIDHSEPNYDSEGWRRIGTEGGSGQNVYPDKYTIKDGSEEPLETDVRQLGFHVVRVDGGNFN